MNERAELLVRLLSERYGMEISEDIAREDISNHVDLVAEGMRVGRQAAKFYVTEDTISDMANRIGQHVNQELAARGEQVRPHLRVAED